MTVPVQAQPKTDEPQRSPSAAKDAALAGRQEPALRRRIANYRRAIRQLQKAYNGAQAASANNWTARSYWLAESNKNRERAVVAEKALEEVTKERDSLRATVNGIGGNKPWGYLATLAGVALGVILGVLTR